MGWSCSAPLLALWLCACAPALDWRQASLEGSGVTALFPCRPASISKSTQIGGRPITMSMHACTADGSTFALSSAQIDDVRAVGPVLAELSASAARNIGADLGAGAPFQVPGMTPHVAARSFLMAGRRADGGVLFEYMAVFTKGTRVYQVFVLGSHPDAEAARTFFSSLRLEA